MLSFSTSAITSGMISCCAVALLWHARSYSQCPPSLHLSGSPGCIHVPLPQLVELVDCACRRLLVTRCRPQQCILHECFSDFPREIVLKAGSWLWVHLLQFGRRFRRARHDAVAASAVPPPVCLCTSPSEPAQYLATTAAGDRSHGASCGGRITLVGSGSRSLRSRLSVHG